MTDMDAWTPWLRSIRISAKFNKVWSLIDPDLNEEEIEAPITLPVTPEYPTRTRLGRGATDEQLDARDQLYQEGVDEYTRVPAIRKDLQFQCEKQEKALLRIATIIHNTIDPVIHIYMEELDTVHEKMRFLKERFEQPDEKDRWHNKWKMEKIRTPRKGEDVQTWAKNWDQHRKYVISLNLESDDYHAKDFLDLTQEFLPIWWYQNHEKIVINQEDINATKLVDSFRLTYEKVQRNAKNKAASAVSRPAFATSTLHGHPEAAGGEDTAAAARKPRPFKDRHTCPCGQKHAVTACYALNEAVRPAGWVLYDSTQARIDRAFKKEPAWKDWADKRIKVSADVPEASNTTNSVAALCTIMDPLHMNDIKGDVDYFTLSDFDHKNKVFAAAPADFSTTTRQRAFATGFSKSQNRDIRRDQWVMDSGSSTHVCNDRSRFLDFKTCKYDLSTGEGSTPAYGIGTVRITGLNPANGEPHDATLADCLYSPNFHANLVSLAKIEGRGAWWDTRKCAVFDASGRPILATYLDTRQQIFLLYQPEPQAYKQYLALYSVAWKDVSKTSPEAPEKTSPEAPDTTDTTKPSPEAPVDTLHTALATRDSRKPLVSKASARVWHSRLGHVYQGAIQQLPGLVDGIEITVDDLIPEGEICRVCSLTDAPRQISRRSIGQHYGRCSRVYFDLIQLTAGYNGHRWVTHFYVEGIRFHWLVSHEEKSGCQAAIRAFIAWGIRWLKLPFQVFHSDNERSVDHAILAAITALGCLHIFTVPHCPEMNGPAERSGGLIVKRARALLHEGKLPFQLWPEAVYTAAYLLNRTPTKTSDGWIVPWDEARKFIAMRLNRVPRLQTFAYMAL
ncbi:hypothetical protein N7490_006838 [Penicillium lividum]|nr:hypothetical protein N7490_006838 [Penicillium lividum]